MARSLTDVSTYSGYIGDAVRKGCWINIIVGPTVPIICDYLERVTIKDHFSAIRMNERPFRIANSIIMKEILIRWSSHFQREPLCSGTFYVGQIRIQCISPFIVPPCQSFPYSLTKAFNIIPKTSDCPCADLAPWPPTPLH